MGIEPKNAVPVALIAPYAGMAELARKGEIDATVTGPINKEAINLAGFHYSGHTEIYADFTHTKDYAMLLVHDHFRVIHVSTHVSMREACNRVKKDHVCRVIRLGYDAVSKRHLLRILQRPRATDPVRQSCGVCCVRSSRRREVARLRFEIQHVHTVGAHLLIRIADRFKIVRHTDVEVKQVVAEIGVALQIGLVETHANRCEEHKGGAVAVAFMFRRLLHDTLQRRVENRNRLQRLVTRVADAVLDNGRRISQPAG
ncbi:MAG: 4-hydroxythreonine-4-phosphate dehydrogenase PdxA, partial [Syntrophales bacterium]|nr:4-hydroxythreonine-4-phosphate dehydrogenase PdxA [Syntrophales bacterium]